MSNNEKLTMNSMAGKIVSVHIRSDMAGNPYTVNGMCKGIDSGFIMLYETTAYLEETERWIRFGDSWFPLSGINQISILERDSDISDLIHSNIEKYRVDG